MRVMLKRLTITGSTLRIRPIEFKGRIARAVEERVLPLIVCGQDQSADRQHLSARARQRRACTHGEAARHIGKIVLTICYGFDRHSGPIALSAFADDRVSEPTRRIHS